MLLNGKGNGERTSSILSSISHSSWLDDLVAESHKRFTLLKVRIRRYSFTYMLYCFRRNGIFLRWAPVLSRLLIKLSVYSSCFKFSHPASSLRIHLTRLNHPLCRMPIYTREACLSISASVFLYRAIPSVSWSITSAMIIDWRPLSSTSGLRNRTTESPFLTIPQLSPAFHAPFWRVWSDLYRRAVVRHNVLAPPNSSTRVTLLSTIWTTGTLSTSILVLDLFDIFLDSTNTMRMKSIHGPGHMQRSHQ